MQEHRKGRSCRKGHHPGRFGGKWGVFLASLLLAWAAAAGPPPSIHHFDPREAENCAMCHSATGADTSSDFCLQCHDNTVAAGLHLNRAMLGEGNPYGIHPVGIRLIPGEGLRVPDPGAEVRLFGPGGDTVECLSCHFAHDAGRGMTVPHLIGGRDYCLQCHIR